jgi:hypothetical protein
LREFPFRHYVLGVTFNYWPAGGGENHYGEASASDVLLVTQIFVRGDKYLEASKLCSGKQLAIAQGRPSLFVGG